MLVTLFVGKVKKQTVELRYNDVVYKRVNAKQGKITWSTTILPLDMVDEMLTCITGEWTDGKGVLPVKRFRQTTIWDDRLEGAAYVIFHKDGEILAAFKHLDSFDISSYIDKTVHERWSISEQVKELETHKDYISLM